MSLTLSTQPGFTEILDSAFATGSPLTQALLTALNAVAKFAAVRNEQFYGYYKDGETMVLPASPADAYQYSRAELRYSWSIYSTGAVPGALNGTETAPISPESSAGGEILQVTMNVDQATGAVSCGVAYFKTSQTNTNDGILLVITHAQRSR